MKRRTKLANCGISIGAGQGMEEVPATGGDDLGGTRRDGDPLADWFDSSHAPALAERIRSLLPSADDQPASSGASRFAG